MQLTDKQIRETLGLKSHAEHEYDIFLNELPLRAPTITYEQAVRARYHHTGRTTEILIRALAAVSQGYFVFIVGHTHSHAQNIVAQARRYADRLGLDPRSIKAETASAAEKYHPHSGVLVFTDHYNGGEG